MSKKIRFTPDMKIIAAVFAHPDAHTVFRRHGLKCVDPKYADSIELCVASEVETMREGAGLHGFDLVAVLADLNALPPSEAPAP
ncbi:MAG: disulfide oxidoreductase [Planctomycetota bacterium]|nr:MAG: disulfide oxidoreductase [Planctomycetota bacterium]